MSTATDLCGLGVSPEVAKRTGFSIVTKALSAGAQGSGQLVGPGNQIILATPASGDDAVTLPQYAGLGDEIYVVNLHASNSLDVFPYSGHTINKLSVNQGVAVATGASLQCIKATATTWFVRLAAAPSAT